MEHSIPEQIPDEAELQELADFYRVFADKTRVKLMYQLLSGEKKVGEISERVGISQSATSHQLRYLKEKGLVANRRAGQSIYYRLIDEHIVMILSMGLEHILEPGNEHQVEHQHCDYCDCC